MNTHLQTQTAVAHTRFHRIVLRVTCALAMVMTQLVYADEWTGSADSDWFNSANWSFFIAPTSSTPRLVIIDNGASNPARIGGAGIGIEDAEATTISIGVNASGALDIVGGGRQLLSGDATLGRFWGSEAVVSVNGPDAQWGILGNLVVGNEGAGQITVAMLPCLGSTAMSVSRNFVIQGSGWFLRPL